ncbi:MAG: radical SAM protein [Planctomycetota bacterium]
MIRQAYQEILARAPNPSELTRWCLKIHDKEILRTCLQDSPEFREIITPLRKEVHSAYEKFCFRKPLENEIVHHISQLRERCTRDEAILSAVSSGRAHSLLDIRPINLELDITNQCNLRCVMCPFSQPSYYKRKIEHMPVEVFQKLAEDFFSAVHCLSLAYGSESLLHPEFIRFITLASSYGIKKIYINTNGMLLTEKLAAKMVEIGFHGISISLDAATSETYNRIRKGGDFDRVLRNIHALNRIRAKAGSPYPRVTLLFVLMKQNIHELPAFVDLARELGAVGVNAMHMIPFKMLDNQDQTAIVDKRQCNEILAEARRRAQAAGINFAAPREFNLEEQKEGNNLNGEHGKDKESEIKQRFSLNVDSDWEKRFHCPFPWHFIAIDMHGNIVPCGWWYGQKVMGNIHEQELMDIWHNEQYQALRKELTTRQLRDCCRMCPAAGMGDPDSDAAFSTR